MDLTRLIPTLQERSRRGHGLLERSRTLLGSGDRMLLASLVSWMEGLSPLIGAATTQTELVLHIQQQRPSLLICTDRLEEGSGLGVLQEAKKADPSLKTLLLLQRPLARSVLSAIEQGCDGICSAELIGSGSMLAALNAMDTDGTYIDGIASGILRLAHLRDESLDDSAMLSPLSLREEDVLQGLCRGMTNQEVAQSLTVSVDTVKSHVSSLLRKMGVNDRTQAVVKAFQAGLVDLSSTPSR